MWLEFSWFKDRFLHGTKEKLSAMDAIKTKDCQWDENTKCSDANKNDDADGKDSFAKHAFNVIASVVRKEIARMQLPDSFKCDNSLKQFHDSFKIIDDEKQVRIC